MAAGPVVVFSLSFLLLVIFISFFLDWSSQRFINFIGFVFNMIILVVTLKADENRGRPVGSYCKNLVKTQERVAWTRSWQWERAKK